MKAPIVPPSSDTAISVISDLPTLKPFKLSVRDNNERMVFQTNVQSDAADKIANIIRELPGKEQRKVLDTLRREIRDQTLDSRVVLERAYADRKRDLANVEAKIKAGHDAIAILDELVEWTDQATGGVHLQRARQSRAHALQIAIDNKRVIQWSTVAGKPEAHIGGMKQMLPIGQIFIVEHDWAGAFAGAKEYEDRSFEFSLPYENTCFEFQFSGKHVCALSSNTHAVDHDVLVAVFVELQRSIPGAWLQLNPNDAGWEPPLVLIADQIKAICVALDAEVATTEVIRAPHRLNRAREKAGKLPVFDYHVVKLARRSRPATLPESDGENTGTRKRLHFRRGHWRHYSTHKTWIKWMLVGDPDLGFIDKQYRL